MVKRQVPEKYDAGNPEAAREITRIAKEVATKQGKGKPDDSEEFYKEFNQRTDPRSNTPLRKR